MSKSRTSRVTQVIRSTEDGLIVVPKEISLTKTLTTGALMKLCDVAYRTVAKWCNTGQLPHYIIPSGHDRRIYIKDALRFFQKRQMYEPAHVLLSLLRPCVALIGLPQHVNADLSGKWLLPYSVSCRIYGNPIEAASEFWRYPPTAIVVDAAVGVSQVFQLVKYAGNVAKQHGLPFSHAVVGCEGDVLEGYEGFVCRSGNMQLLIEAIQPSLPIRVVENE
jgi:hypothetical protein